MKPRVILFCDYGLDDAVATAHLFENADRFSGIDIVPIGGNMPLDIATRNAHTLVHICGMDSRVRIVDTSKIEQPSENLTFIHGEDGMGGIFMPMKSTAETVEFSEWAKTVGKDDIVVSLGPATVPAKLLEICGARKLIIMGGCGNHEPNHKGYEFNQELDKKAFTELTKYPHAAATLESVTDKRFDISLEKREGATVLEILKRRYIELANERGEGCYVWDDGAVTYLLHPEIFFTRTFTDIDGNKVTSIHLK